MLAGGQLDRHSPRGLCRSMRSPPWPWPWPWSRIRPTAASPDCKGRARKFGRWLDQVLDELADLAIHAGIAWAAFRQPVNRSGSSSESCTPPVSICSWSSPPRK